MDKIKKKGKTGFFFLLGMRISTAPHRIFISFLENRWAILRDGRCPIDPSSLCQCSSASVPVSSFGKEQPTSQPHSTTWTHKKSGPNISISYLADWAGSQWVQRFPRHKLCSGLFVPFATLGSAMQQRPLIVIGCCRRCSDAVPPIWGPYGGFASRGFSAHRQRSAPRF